MDHERGHVDRAHHDSWTLKTTERRTAWASLHRRCSWPPHFRFQNATEAGRFHVEHPTLLNLGFEWAITGDANRNATVTVQFRAVGETAWRSALPLVRIGGENVYRRRENLDYTVPDGFAGSILNLSPGTEYECRFQLTDPDGATGETSHTVTREDPHRAAAFQGGPHAARLPARLQGQRKSSPASPASCRPTTAPASATGASSGSGARSPATRILVHAGLYKPERLNYVDPMMTPFDGTMSLTLKGTPEKPITIKAAGDGEVIFDGDGNHRLFDVMASQLSHLRRPDDPQHRRRHLRRAEGSARRGRADGEELPLRERRLRRLDRVRRLERFLHRRQPVPRPRRPLPPRSAGPGRCGPAPGPTARICSRATTPSRSTGRAT